MQRPAVLLRDLSARHTSAASALLDPVVTQKDTPACLGDLLRFLRDNQGSDAQNTDIGFAEMMREIRKEPRLLTPFVRKFRRYEPKGHPIGSWDAYGLHRFIGLVARKWSLAPNLQHAHDRDYTSRAIVGIAWPWFHDPRFISIMGDGFGLLKFRVLATDEGGPTRFRLLRMDDPELNEFIASPAVPDCIREGRKHPAMHKGFFHDGERFDKMIIERKLDGDLDIAQFEAVLWEAFRPSSFWFDRKAAPPVDQALSV